jgi:hypothetical protein
VSDSIGVAIVWGPIAGYYAKQLGVDLVLTPVDNDSVSRIPFVYSMGFATRRRERAFRDSLQKFLDLKAPEIRGLLEGYGIPLLPLAADTTAGTTRTGPAR